MLRPPGVATQGGETWVSDELEPILTTKLIAARGELWSLVSLTDRKGKLYVINKGKPTDPL